MNLDTLASRMRRQEIYQTQRALDGAWAILRVDGRGFSKLTEARFAKPFDPTFHDLMVGAARTLMEELQAPLAYTQSDEISLVLPPSWDLFDRRVEKIVSIGAATATASFSIAHGAPVHFDGRLWVGPSLAYVREYFLWREADASRCALSTAVYWTLRNAGHTAREAHRALDGAGVSEKNELLFAQGINFNELPVWQRRGVVLSWETYEKKGYNPVTDEEVLTERRRITADEDIPRSDAFADRVVTLLDA